MNKKYTINYRKKWDSKGTVYDQAVNITENELQRLRDAHLSERILLDIEIKKNGYDNVDYYYQLYLGNAYNCERLGNVVFTNHTQRDFFNRFLRIPNLKNRNTCFIIN